ncbi:MAG: hypothetical protein AAF721_34910 [Myxococcota bacterium]
MVDRGWIVGALVLVAVACASDDGGVGDSAAQGSSESTASSSSDGGGDPTEAGSTGSVASTGGSSDGADSSGSADSSSGGEPVECFGMTCDAGQACVRPCCGGAGPQCVPMTPGERCESGTCMQPDGTQGCTLSCTPDPPFCADLADLTCEEDSCDVGSCNGPLANGLLDCECQ